MGMNSRWQELGRPCRPWSCHSLGIGVLETGREEVQRETSLTTLLVILSAGILVAQRRAVGNARFIRHANIVCVSTLAQSPPDIAVPLLDLLRNGVGKAQGELRVASLILPSTW